MRRNSNAFKFVTAGAVCAALFLAGSLCRAEESEGLVEGRAALQDGFNELAEAKFSSWLQGKSQPEKEVLDVLNLYCRALDGLGRTKDIRKVAETGWPSEFKSEGTPMAAYWSAYCDYRDGKFDAVTNALVGFDITHGASSFAPNALRLKGWALLALTNKDAAVSCFEAYEKKYAALPGRMQNLVELGDLLLSSGKAGQAEGYLRKILDIEGSSPEKARGLHLYGMALRSCGKGAEARGVFEKLAADESVAGDVRAEAWFEAAGIGVTTGDVAGAISACVEGLKLTQEPGLQMRGSVLHGRVLIDSGKLDEGVAVLKGQIVKMSDPAQSAALQLEIARALLKADRDEAAVGEFQFYLETFTNVAGLADAHLGKGWGLFRLDRFAEAAGSFSRAYELSESAAQKEESLYKMGDAYFANGQHKLALDTYDKFMKEFKDSERIKNVSFQRAEALAGSGRLDEAELEYQKIAGEYADVGLGAESRLKIGKIKFDRQDNEGAIVEFELVMKGFPKTEYFVRALHGRAKIYFSSGAYEKALKDLEQITERYPHSSSAEDATYEKGLCYHRMGKIDEVEKVFAQLLSTYPYSKWAPDVVFWQGENEFNCGDFEKAEKVFSAFVTKYPDSVLVSEALLRAGMAASGRREYVHAIELFNKLAKEHPSSACIPDARFAQANALCELGKFSEAILPLDEIINKYPDSVLAMPAWGRKGDCHFVMGTEDEKRYEESIQSYRVVVSSSKSTPSMVLQSEYKIGRSLEKMGKTREALERYYSRVIIPFLEQKERGEKHDESSRVWFTRASLGAAAILEAQQDWRRAANVLERLAESGVPAAKEAAVRAKKIRSENWWLFY